MHKSLKWTVGLLIAVVVAVVPTVYYRHTYTHSKRLREVVPGKLYRSGCMTAPGFRDAIVRHGIRLVVNLMDEDPDPDLPEGYFATDSMRESDLCEQLGVRYVALPADLVLRSDIARARPKVIDEFLRIMDDEASWPVLIHCRAGLHRTGCIIAVYRMEYDGWTPAQAVRELKQNGFGEFNCSTANDYITQYIMTYQRGVRRSVVSSP